MKKKFLAVALAATMMFSSVVSVFGATAETFSGAVFVENTGDEELTGDFNISYTFNNKTSGTDNWDNFIIEFYSDAVESGTTGKGYLTLRADAFGWWAEGWAADGGQTPNDFSATWAGTEAGWDDWMATMADADVTVTASRSGEKIAVSYDIKGANGVNYAFSNVIENIYGFGDTIKVHLTAEECTLSNIKYNPDSAPAETQSTTAAETQSTTSADQKMKPSVASKDNNQFVVSDTAAEEEGNSNVVIFVVIAVVAVVIIAGVVVVVTKKKK